MMVTSKNKSGMLRSPIRIVLMVLIIKEKPLLIAMSLRVIEKQSSSLQEIASPRLRLRVLTERFNAPLRARRLAMTSPFDCKYMDWLLFSLEEYWPQRFDFNIFR